MILAEPSEDKCTGLNNINPICQGKQQAGRAIDSIGSSAIEKFASAVADGVAESVKQLTTIWTKIPTPDVESSVTVDSLQASLWWCMSAVAVLSVIVAGGRMAWQQRAQPGKDLLRSLIVLVLVTGAGVATVNLALQAGDQFAAWIIDESLAGQSFGKRMSVMLAGITVGTGGLGIMLVILVGMIIIFATLAQIALMIARSAMLVFLCGVWPLAAADTSSDWGRQWFTKISGWIIAFVLYKPAAALVYAAAFTMFGEEKGLMGALSGCAMMVLAIFALPALMRLSVPMVASLAGGAGGAATGAMAASAAMRGPTGARPAQPMSTPSSAPPSAGGGSPAGAGLGSSASGSHLGGSSGAAASGGGAGSGAGATAAGAGAAASGGAAAAALLAQKSISGAQKVAGEATEGDGPRGSN